MASIFTMLWKLLNSGCIWTFMCAFCLKYFMDLKSTESLHICDLFQSPLQRTTIVNMCRKQGSVTFRCVICLTSSLWNNSASQCLQVCLKDINTLRLKQNDCHFPDENFKCIFLNENVWFTSKISLKFNPQGPINNIPALVQIMAWWWSGTKPLSEPMMV